MAVLGEAPIMLVHATKNELFSLNLELTGRLKNISAVANRHETNLRPLQQQAERAQSLSTLLFGLHKNEHNILYIAMHPTGSSHQCRGLRRGHRSPGGGAHSGGNSAQGAGCAAQNLKTGLRFFYFISLDCDYIETNDRACVYIYIYVCVCVCVCVCSTV